MIRAFGNERVAGAFMVGSAPVAGTWTHIARVAALCASLAPVAAGCSSSSPGGSGSVSLSCVQSLGDYCGAGSTCTHTGAPVVPLHLNPSDVAGSICSVCGPSCYFAIETCADHTVQIVLGLGSSPTAGTQLLHFQYTATALDLNAVVETSAGGQTYQASTSCLAGPASTVFQTACSDTQSYDGVWRCAG